MFVLIVISPTYQTPNLCTAWNTTNVLRQGAGVGIMSSGMRCSIRTRGISLSGGSMSALGSVLRRLFPS